MPKPARLNMARGPAHVAGKLERGLLRELAGLREGDPEAGDGGVPGTGGVGEGSAGEGKAVPGGPEATAKDGTGGAQDAVDGHVASKEFGEARESGAWAAAGDDPDEARERKTGDDTDGGIEGRRESRPGNAGADGSGRAGESAAEAIAGLLLASGLAHETPPPSGRRAEFRLRPPFAGEAVIERDGTVRLLTKELDPDLALRLFVWMAEEARLAAPVPACPLPAKAAPSRPEPQPRGPTRPGVRGRSGLTREAVLTAFRETPGTTQAIVARELGLAQQTVSRHARALREAGLLPRGKDDEDCKK